MRPTAVRRAVPRHRVVETIFRLVEEADSAVEFTLKVSYVEIYMERAWPSPSSPTL